HRHPRSTFFPYTTLFRSCTGMAASMGAVLLCAGEKGKRSALPHSRVMIHQPSGGAQGVAADMEINLREMLKLKNELYTIIANHRDRKSTRLNSSHVKISY